MAGGSRHDQTLPPAGFLVALIGTAWLATRRYQGLVLDARLYTVQALHLLDPARYAGDLYFAFGSQDRFTIFSWFYAPLLHLLGVAWAGLLLTVAGEALWLFGVAALARALLADRRLALVATFGVVVLPGAYGPYGFGEPFLTPRLYAEGLTLFALAALLRGRPLVGSALLALAAALHPLMAVPGIAVACCRAALRRPVLWGLLPVAAGGAAALAGGHVAPFDRLLLAYDPAWFAVTRLRDSMALLGGWRAGDWATLGATAALWGIGWRTARGAVRPWLLAAALAAGGGLMVTLAGGDVARNVFIVDVQPWRALWIATLLAHLLVAPALLRPAGGGGPPRALLAAGTGLLAVSAVLPPVLWLALPPLAAALLVPLLRGSGRPRLAGGVRVAANAFALAAIGLAVAALGLFRSALAAAPGEYAARAGALTIVAGAVALLAIRLRRPHPLLPWAALGLIGVAALTWDARSAWTRFVEAAPAAADPAPPFDPAAMVYWEGGVDLLWLHWRRPDFFSCLQGTGALFSRPTAFAYRDRARAMAPLRTLDFAEPPLCPAFPGVPVGPRPAALRAACAALPRLDDIVLTRPVPGVAARIWTPPVPFTALRPIEGRLMLWRADRFFVYACQKIRFSVSSLKQNSPPADR